jgi:hypothetical protein
MAYNSCKTHEPLAIKIPTSCKLLEHVEMLHQERRKEIARTQVLF